MTPDTSENKIQKNSINLLQSLGYKFVSREENLKLRGGKTSEVLFREILTQKLGEINGYEYKGKRYKFSQSSILKAVDELAGISLNEGLMVANERITNLLLLGTSLEENLEDGTRRSFSFKFIDFENLQNNDFYVTEEFEVSRVSQSDAQKHRRPDLVLFINGIPIVVIELKKSSVSFENGIKQLEKEQGKDEIAHLFKYIQLTIAANGSGARYGTTGTPFKFYSVWKEQDEAKAKESLKSLINGREVSALDMTLFALLSKDRLLRLVRHYIVFDKKMKKVCRYQQFFAIEETLKRVSAKKEGARAGGLIWHTQGSGKSLTMVMLTKLLKQIYINSKIIVVTDRIDLDGQIHETFENTDVKAGRASSGSDLIEKLQSGVSVITTLVHKFEKVKNQKVVIRDGDIFVLVDESHRTQGGDLHKAMKKALPLACYIGFTGTPLLKREKNSFAKFGGEIHRYTIDDAVKDGAVLPLFYEGRYVGQEVLDPEGLTRKFDLISRELGDEAKRDLQQKWARFERVASSEQRLELIAVDINEHIKKTLKKSGFKAMLATQRKYDAIKYHQIFEEFAELRSAYVISSNEHEELEGGNKEYIAKAWQETIKEYGSEEAYLKYVKDEFVNGDEIDLLIVVDKLLMGFDAPRASTLYIDKQLKEHNLLQAIARVNRLYDGKDYGYIIDYRGLLGELDEALTSYASLSGFDLEDLSGAVMDVRSEIVKAKTYYTHLDGLFSDVKFKDDLESYVAVLEDVQKRDDFKEWLSQFARAFKLALSSEKICDILSEEEIKAYKQRVKFYNELRKAVQLRYHEACDFGKYEAQMQKLLDTYVSAEEVNELTKLVNIFETEFDDEVQRVEGKNAKADTIISAVSAVVKEKMESNPAFYKSIAKQIQDVIDEYKAKRLSEEEKLAKAKQLKDLITGALKPNEDRYPKEFNGKEILFAIYDNLLDILGNVELADIETVTKNLSMKFYEIYEQASKKPEWHKNMDVENEITSAMEDALWDVEDEYGVSIDDKEKIYQTIRGIGISFYAK
ncbi:type I restriction endonuclease subunit R [Campylobacter concisus]|jgi:type I site-specific deoxyribonuclease, hsdR family|uniref:type I restriction endonuclease subunit R n=1 Tax=Campylobacter concisus TaxID=199 RepID=UPI000CD8E176|nr:type I restriction endonuclease subunit R [Campylobacter concisus]MCA6131383.1 type I restriction endonuclease subunit R [Campylobacter concisus]MCA6131735.1 type I restriction endonuclease subunit R [Campylobacter concisus]